MKKKELPRILTDIHSHILPGVDDGSQTVENSLEILWQASRSGVKNVVFTPHFSYRRRFVKTREEIQAHYLEFINICSRAELPLNFYLGSEVEFSYDMLQELYRGKLFSMAESGCMLVEFEPMTRGKDIIENLRLLSSLGYTPILAHVERYPDFISDFDNIWCAKEDGALIQMNILSLVGRTKAFCKKVLKLRLVDFIATDTHRVFPPDEMYIPALKKLESWTSPDYCSELLNDNAVRYIIES